MHDLLFRLWFGAIDRDESRHQALGEERGRGARGQGVAIEGVSITISRGRLVECTVLC
jgi:hypothetical protein